MSTLLLLGKFSAGRARARFRFRFGVWYIYMRFSAVYTEKGQKKSRSERNGSFVKRPDYLARTCLGTLELVVVPSQSS